MSLEEGSEVVKFALRHRPEVITLDLILPGISGLEILEALKSNDQTRHIPVVCVSISDDLSSRALALGAAQYIRKPVDPKALLNAIRSASAVVTG